MIYLAIGLLVSAGLAYGISVLFKKYEQVMELDEARHRLVMSQQTLLSKMWDDLESIKSARGTFSRRLDEFESFIHSVADKVDRDHVINADNARFPQGYLDSQVADRLAKKTVKKGK